MSHKPVANGEPSLGFWDLLSISVGQIIGAGIVILTGIGISITGYGTPWTFFLALAIVALPTLCIAALGAAVPSTGGTYTYVRDLISPKVAFLYLSLLVAGQLVLATYAIGFADYAQEFLPGVDMKFVAFAVMTFCFAANLFGIKSAARFQKFMVIVLLVSLIAFIAYGLPLVKDYSNYTQMDKVLPSGIGGFISAAFIMRFGLIGSEFVSELGGETRNPGKTIPRVMMTSLVVITFLYAAVGVVATGVLPLPQVQGQSLAFIAKEIFPPAVYMFFVLGGVMLALVTSLNAIFAWCTKGLYMAAQDGWLPIGCARKNRFGTPYILLTVFYLVGIFPIATGMTLEYVTILGNVVGIIFGIIPALALYNLYDRNPEAYERASFKVPKPALKILPVIAFCIYAYGAYLSFTGFIEPPHIVVLIVYVFLTGAYIWWRFPHVKKQGAPETAAYRETQTT